MLLGRRTEVETLDRLVEDVGAGASRALVVRGEAGMGKSALLAEMAQRASACRVARVAGLQPEMELPFAGLHQLCAPLLDRLEAIPVPQRDALGRAFGVRSGPAPDRFMVALAVLSLLDEASRERPLICVVDDAQWLDRTSRQALACVARRLQAESLALLFAVKEPDPDLRDLPELVVSGLSDADARDLLRLVAHMPLDEQILDRVVDEAHGNPLALLEVSRDLADGRLAGGFGLPAARSASGLVEDGFRRRLERQPADVRRLALVAAAEPVGEPVLVWRAAERLGIDTAAAAAEAGDLVQLAGAVRFRHPLARSVVYEAASPDERRATHAALAAVTDAAAEPDRHAWHRAHATAEPDEDVAAELERAADAAQARGGMSAAAAFLHRATVLTPDPAQRARRALSAAQAEHEAGAPDAALTLLVMAEAGALSDIARARAKLLHAEIAFTVNRGKDAPGLLVAAAKELEPLDVRLARDTYLQALSAAMFAGRLSDGEGLVGVAWAARVAPAAPNRPPRVADLLLDALAVLMTEDARTATPLMRRALDAFDGGDVSVEEELRWLWLAFITAVGRWDDRAARALAIRHVQLARDAGLLAVLPLALSSMIVVHLFEGELDAAAALSEEVRAITEATGMHLTNYGALALAAWVGREAEAARLMETSWRSAAARSEGIGLTVIQWTSAVLANGLGRYDDARDAALHAAVSPAPPGAAHWALAELVEAASRSGDDDVAADALARLTATTGPAGTDWALGIEARCRALLEEDPDRAEALYRGAIDRLGRTRLRVDHARARLLYGEWLRRQGRRVDAREELRGAHELFAATGMDAFEQRAARELQATGAALRRRVAAAGVELTAQEAQVARLARDGFSNPEIGSRLFISPRTVEYHLGKVFTKLGITSRTKLASVLANGSPDPDRAWG